MRNRWLAGMLAGCLAGHAPASAAEPLPLASFVAILPQAPQPTERPTDLPNIDSRLDIRPLLRTPSASSPEPKRTPLRDRLLGPDYDPSYLFLPERNPGLRQPPCPCLPLGTFWVNTAYFLGVTESNAIAPLATTGGNGVLGAPGVSVVHGNDRLEQPFRSGMRLEIGSWLDRCHNWGIESSFFFMQSTQARWQVSSGGDPLLARPFANQSGNLPGVDVLAAPGVSQGALSVSSPLTFIGCDVNSRHNLLCEDHYRLDLLAGYRFVRMSEQLNIHSHSEAVSGITSDVDDTYSTVNMFNGGQIGWAGETRFDRLYLAGSMKVAFGMNWSSLDIQGQTRGQVPGESAVVGPGGLLANRSIMGTSTEARFAVVPEATFTVGYQVADHWRAYLGYTFVYISSVARPGQAIDLNISTTSAARNDPSTDFWMHGINFGIEARY